MTLQRILWRSTFNDCKFVVDESRDGNEITIKGTPVITEFYFGVTVGMLTRTSDSFGYWESSNVCGPVTAWRVLQILPRMRRLRTEHGYDSTMCGLVIALQNDESEKRRRKLAEDFDMNVEDFNAMLDNVRNLWPEPSTLNTIWDRLSTAAQDRFAPALRQAIDDGDVAGTNDLGLIVRLEAAETRLRTGKQQKEHEDRLIEAGLTADVSLRQLLVDIGVSNLVYTIGCGDIGEPSHFKFEDLDREIMTELIGTRGFCRNIGLYTTPKQPNDPTAHHTAGGGGITMFMSDFGKATRPRLTRDTLELIRVRWDKVTERLVLVLRPPGLDEDDFGHDVHMSIADLRVHIGTITGLDRPLNPGETPNWLQKPTFRQGLNRILGRDTQ
ncbi:hypothetical protein BH09PAT3_BH09PAT3_3830 [soil metagenome]